MQTHNHIYLFDVNLIFRFFASFKIFKNGFVAVLQEPLHWIASVFVLPSMYPVRSFIPKLSTPPLITFEVFIFPE